MFRKDEEVLEFLEETKELIIPKEILKNRKDTLEIIEQNMDVQILKKYEKKVSKYLKKTNRDYLAFIRKNRPRKFLKFCFLASFFILPVLSLFGNITNNTNYSTLQELNVYIEPLFSILGIIICVTGLLLIISAFKNKSWKLRHNTMMTIVILALFSGGIFSLNDLLYGSDKKYQDLIIKEMMNTRNHQYVASIFYNNRIIENTLLKNNVPLDESEIYEFEPINYETNEYANEYEKEILTRDSENDIYKIIKIEGTLRDGVNKYSGYMTVVYDPANVTIGTSVGAGTTEDSFGQILAQISKNNQALVAMNAGGFYDPNWSSNGGIPHGTVIQNGEIKTDYNRGIESGGLIGFTKDNQLVLKRMTAQEAIDIGIRDAVDWGPYLIVNGKNYFKEEKSRWACARSVIGQRKDGIVLLLVIDGDQPHSKGASYSDLADIMERYGAINAANLDGGTSTSMVENHEYINIPFNGKKRTIRSLPNAWIVKDNSNQEIVLTDEQR